MVKKYWYPCHLPCLPHCKVRMRFPAKSVIFNGTFHTEWFISPLTAHIYIAQIEKEPPSLPHLRYLCNLINDRSIQNHAVILPNCLGEFLSIENGKEEIPEKEFMRSFQVAWLLVQRCSQRDLPCNAMTLWSNHYLCISFEPMLMSKKRIHFAHFFRCNISPFL
jgi:hypothetical protein